MKYLTKEELEEVTGKLLENPTRETLKELNNKYNGEDNAGTSLVLENTSMQPIVEENSVIEAPQSYEMPMTTESVVEPIPNTVESPMVNPLPPVMDTPVAAPMANYEIPTPSVSIETPTYDAPNIQTPVEMSNPQEVINPVQEQNIPVNNVSMGPEIPSFDVPQMSNQNMDSINNEPINFTGNLWEPQNQNDLMATTDSFNQGPIEQPTVEVPVGNGPFFGTTTEPVNNPIPINNNMPQMPPQGPSMFGQFEQNYNG